MKKEEREILKKYRLEAKEKFKPIIKRYGYKGHSNTFLYKKIGEYFLFAYYHLFYNNECKFVITYDIEIKKYNYDNWFWKVINMESNLEQSDSLRAIGAFTCPGLECGRNTYVINSIDEIECLLNDMVSNVEKWGKKMMEIENFSRYIMDNDFPIMNYDVLKIVACLDNGDYKKAFEFARENIRNGNESGFVNEGKSFNEWVLEYCEKQNHIS